MLQHKTRQSGDVTILDLSGRIGLGDALTFGGGSAGLGDAIKDLVRQGNKKILVNLKDVTYIDSSGISELVGAFSFTKQQGGQLKLLHPSGVVREVLRTTHLLQIFDVKEDEPSALNAFAKPVTTGG